MNVWQILLQVSGAGVIGGLAAYLSHHGFRRQLRLKDGGPHTGGWIQTLMLGAVAAALAWALEDPQAALRLTAAAGTASEPGLGDLAASVGIGLTGAKWFASHHDAETYKFLGAIGTANEPDKATAVVLGSGQIRSAADRLDLR